MNLDDDAELAALRRMHDQKFDQICALLATHYGDDPTNLSEARRVEIADEAKELAENWEMATFDDWDLQAKSDLQRLLADYLDIGESILDREYEIARERGFIQDDE
jgi:hypothetical protein